MAIGRRKFRILLVIAVIAPTFTTSAVAEGNQSGPAGEGNPEPTAETFTIDGQVATPLTLTVNDLRRDYLSHAATSRFTAGCVTRGHVYRGVLLTDVLTTARPQFAPAVKNAKLRYAVLVGASDGYQAALSWGEIDPDFATPRYYWRLNKMMSNSLAPTLSCPGDTNGGRYVCDITSLSLLPVKR